MADTSDKSGKRTHDHGEIRAWIEKRGGRPSVVSSTKSGTSALLRVDFGKKEEDNLDFLYQEKTVDGKESRFFKFVERE